jgi:hypothetical protein
MRLLRRVDCRTRPETTASARLRPRRTNLVLQSRHDIVCRGDLHLSFGRSRRRRRRKLDDGRRALLDHHRSRRLGRRRLLRFRRLCFRRTAAHSSGQARNRRDDIRRVDDGRADDQKDDAQRRKLERVVARRRTYELAGLGSWSWCRSARRVWLEQCDGERKKENERKLCDELQAISSLVCRMRPRLNRPAPTHHGDRDVDASLRVLRRGR